MAFLELKNVSKTFGSGLSRTNVLSGIDLEVEEGEFIAILGFSGSGKTTLLSLIAGLVTPDSGSVTLKGAEVTGPGRDRGVAFQNYSLMPWLTVEGNIALSVDAVFATESKDSRAARLTKAIAMVGLSHARHRRPAELSGGMRQRVAVAHALAMSPAILLLDEPLSALDALTRAKLQDEIEQIWRQDKKTVVLITNDVDEALLLADRVIPLMPGPGAKLGQSFKVELARPRNRAALNHDETYKKLRADITNALIRSRQTHGRQGDRRGQSGPERDTPVTRMTPLPKAYRDAAKPHAPDRYLEFFELCKVYPTPKGPLTVVEDFSLIMRKGEFVSLIGHSGCGKSTVLSMAAGLNPITSGGIVLDGQEVTEAGPDRAVVFQAPSLMPWLTARENVALGVDRVYSHASKSERRDIVDYYLARVGLADAMDKPAAELSNGMRQRVGIARAFSLSLKLLLLDEPLGMLDSLTRWELQEVLMDVWKRTQVTALCVTHDVDEAILLADRVVMMTNGPNARIGRIVDIDIPRPRSRQELLGHPSYYEYRKAILSFLEEFEHGATGSPSPSKDGGKPKTLEDAA